MKMKAFLLLLAMMCILGATCFAENAPLNQDAVPLPHERMALGGIHIGDTMENVKSILGNPDSKDYGYSQMAEKKVATWAYGNSASIYFFENNGEYYVQIVKVDADNGFATPDGIKVGHGRKSTEEGLRRAVFLCGIQERDGTVPLSKRPLQPGRIRLPSEGRKNHQYRTGLQRLNPKIEHKIKDGH